MPEEPMHRFIMISAVSKRIQSPCLAHWKCEDSYFTERRSCSSSFWSIVLSILILKVSSYYSSAPSCKTTTSSVCVAAAFVFSYVWAPNFSSTTSFSWSFSYFFYFSGLFSNYLSSADRPLSLEIWIPVWSPTRCKSPSVFSSFLDYSSISTWAGFTAYI